MTGTGRDTPRPSWDPRPLLARAARYVRTPAPAPADDPRTRRYAPDYLTELFNNPLDPAYADAAARRAEGVTPTGRQRQVISVVSALTMAAVGFLLVVAYRQTVDDEPARTRAHDTLVAQVQKRRAETTRLQDRADALRDEVARLRQRELGGAAVAELQNLEAATGLARVRGSGAQVKLSDGPTSINPVTGERATDARVKDTDLQLATNALWAGGAEAIAINGERLTATSTIRQAGEAILVDFRPVTTPYQVVAIGPEALADGFDDGYAGRFFRALSSRFGIAFETSAVDDVTLDAAADLTLRVAVPSPTPSTPAPSSRGPGAGPSPSPSKGGR